MVVVRLSDLADRSPTFAAAPLSKAMIRVLSVIHYPFFGGPHNMVLLLDGPLRERGFSTLALLPDEPGNAYERMAQAGVQVIRMPLGRARARLNWSVQRHAFATMIGDVPRLARQISSHSIDLVLVHGLVNPQAAIAGRLRRRPVVWQVLDTRTPLAVRLALAPLVRGLASSVMTTGETVARVHPGIPRGRDRLFPFFMPVDTRLFRPDVEARSKTRARLGYGERDVVIGCVANLTPQKRLEAFIEAARNLAESRPGVRFALFGAPMETHADYANRLLADSRDLRESDRLLVRDVGTNVAEHVRALDVFMATAGPRSEGISTTILEAMSAGVPVVSTDVGAIREAVVHGETGYVVPPDDLAELTRRVEELIDDRALREQFGAAARRRATEEFDVERCADVHAQAFEAALARHSR
jgi:glycosyltransferase involved in cell wall biosynthesis